MRLDNTEVLALHICSLSDWLADRSWFLLSGASFYTWLLIHRYSACSHNAGVCVRRGWEQGKLPLASASFGMQINVQYLYAGWSARNVCSWISGLINFRSSIQTLRRNSLISPLLKTPPTFFKMNDMCTGYSRLPPTPHVVWFIQNELYVHRVHTLSIHGCLQPIQIIQHKCHQANQMRHSVETPVPAKIMESLRMRRDIFGF